MQELISKLRELKATYGILSVSTALEMILWEDFAEMPKDSIEDMTRRVRIARLAGQMEYVSKAAKQMSEPIHY